MPTTASLLAVGLQPKPSTPVWAYFSIVYSDQRDQAFIALTDLLLNQDFMAGGCVLGTASSYMHFET